jgi:hypothetical protein
LLEEAGRSGHWTEWMGLVLSVAVSAYLILSDDVISTNSIGLVILLSSIAGWQIRRLHSRIDALTKILAETGYPGEA